MRLLTLICTVLAVQVEKKLINIMRDLKTSGFTGDLIDALINDGIILEYLSRALSGYNMNISWSFGFVPAELPTLLQLIYSAIPPIRTGIQNSKVGLGFRIGRNADFQFLVELGPPNPPVSSKRDVMTNSLEKSPFDKNDKLYSQFLNKKLISTARRPKIPREYTGEYIGLKERPNDKNIEDISSNEIK